MSKVQKEKPHPQSLKCIKQLIVMCTNALKVSAIETLKSLKSETTLKKQDVGIAIQNVLETVLGPIAEELDDTSIVKKVTDILKNNYSDFDLDKIRSANNDYELAILIIENTISVLEKKEPVILKLKQFVADLKG